MLRQTFGKELPAQAREAEAAIRECQQKLVQLEKIPAELFTYDAEIAEIETRLLQLDREIKAELEEDVEVEFA
ncbi:MAG TPA: hypothetical protein VEC93_02270 [Anaerolineae bacterium]|nr:hypothetical protein [Anaerolineae bacterium]